MLLSPLAFAFRSAVNPEVLTFRTPSFCEGDLAPGEMAHVIDVPDQVGLPFESRLNYLLEPEVQDMMEVQIT
jgi:hypothetical protein